MSVDNNKPSTPATSGVACGPNNILPVTKQEASRHAAPSRIPRPPTSLFPASSAVIDNPLPSKMHVGVAAGSTITACEQPEINDHFNIPERVVAGSTNPVAQHVAVFERASQLCSTQLTSVTMSSQLPHVASQLLCLESQTTTKAAEVTGAVVSVPGTSTGIQPTHGNGMTSIPSGPSSNLDCIPQRPVSSPGKATPITMAGVDIMPSSPVCHGSNGGQLLFHQSSYRSVSISRLACHDLVTGTGHVCVSLLLEYSELLSFTNVMLYVIGWTCSNNMMKQWRFSHC